MAILLTPVIILQSDLTLEKKREKNNLKNNTMK